MLHRIVGAALMGIALTGCASMDKAGRPGPTLYPAGAWPIVSGFGAATNPNGSARAEPHNGVDIPAPLGTPVVAGAEGVVFRVRTGPGIGGNVVYLMTTDSWSRLQLRYAHLDRILVAEGENVVAGQIVGTVGKTGDWVFANEEPHLHFAVLDLSGRRDPEVFLRGEGGMVACAGPGREGGGGARLLYPVACVR